MVFDFVKLAARLLGKDQPEVTEDEAGETESVFFGFMPKELYMFYVLRTQEERSRQEVAGLLALTERDVEESEAKIKRQESKMRRALVKTMSTY